MLAFSVSGGAVKSVMNQLLKRTTFDQMMVRSVEIRLITTFLISGVLDKSFLDRDTLRKFCFWSEIKPFVLDIIKKGSKPKYIKIIFSLSDNETIVLHENAAALFLNIIYEDDKISFTTAVSQREFIMDKTIDYVWDEYIRKFFSSNKSLGVM
jgi:hypothetical protein